MDDLTAALLNALNEVAPKLQNPAELQRRLDRRKDKYFLRPLRAFCIAARASDHRINDTFATIHPRHAISCCLSTGQRMNGSCPQEMTRTTLEAPTASDWSEGSGFRVEWATGCWCP